MTTTEITTETDVPMSEELGELVKNALLTADSMRGRSQQTRDFVLGASDLGFCQAYATWLTKQIPFTDTSLALDWAGYIGTAMHTKIEADLELAMDWVSPGEVVATFPSGAVVPGHPDHLVPEWNMIIDDKTKNGLAVLRREGPSQSNWYQVTTYALGALQAGLLDADKPVWVCIIGFDRSGADPEPAVFMRQLTDEHIAEVDMWITDVIYNVRHNEEPRRDVAAPICERICAYFTHCRGADFEAGPNIEDPEVIHNVAAYRQAMDDEKEAAQRKKEIREQLQGVEGVAGDWNIRWVHVNGGEVAPSYRPGYDRVDIRKARRK